MTVLARLGIANPGALVAKPRASDIEADIKRSQVARKV